MPRALITLGDKTSHGGVVAGGLWWLRWGGRPVARVGDMVACPWPGHGVNPIVSGDPRCLLGGRPVARHGDRCACGAVLLASQWSAQAA